jgi:hypothetical protein
MFSGDDPHLANVRIWMIGGSLHIRSVVTSDTQCALCAVSVQTNATSPPTMFDLRPSSMLMEAAESRDSLDIVEWIMSAEDSVGVKISDAEAETYVEVPDSTTTWPLCVGCVLDFATRCRWIFPPKE